ncbi:sulfite exporter TauE/SafE family protein [Parapedobacter sp. 2B3]|uniref:sulfite exporter TauE/SafE family protein n=1 Tax=Parapedobacter sp. 2B3 TaxID=3342381 RepID=UPI0035B6A4B0
MNYLLLGFFMGVFGSLHCVAMCGPLVLAFSTGNTRGRSWLVIVQTVLYQLGRVLVYGILGLVIGGIGYVLNIKDWQQGITLLTGALLVVVGVFSLFGKHSRQFVSLQQRFVTPLTRWVGYWLYRPGGHFVVGALNGLLPCGMVYMALAAALSAESAMGSGLFMLSFGAGTWPAMIAVGLLGAFAKSRMRFNFAFWLPIISVVIGIWFLLRGANLDIPYLSPLIYPEGAIVCGY